MGILWCIRHGQTDWNVEGRYAGQSDIPLNEKGERDSEAFAESIRNQHVDAVYSSDLIRASDTARLIAEPRGLPVIMDPRLREINQGVWEGMLFPDIKQQYAEEFAKRLENPTEVSPPGGETLGQFRDRVLSALSDIINAERNSRRILTVSHGLTIAVIRVHLEGLEIKDVWDYIPPNTEIVEFEI